MSIMCLAVEFLRGIQSLLRRICSDSPNEVQMLRFRTTMKRGTSSVAHGETNPYPAPCIFANMDM